MGGGGSGELGNVIRYILGVVPAISRISSLREKVMSMLRAFCSAHQIKIIFAYASIHFQSNFAFPQNTRLSTFYLFPSNWKYSTSKSIKMKVHYYQISTILIVPYTV